MTENDELDSRIKKLVSATDPEEVKAAYKEWANSYNSDLDEYGYVAPLVSVRMFQEFVTDTTSKILDAGCGTGLIGTLLKENGYNDLTGSDFSQDMLNEASAAGCYSELQIADFGKPLEDSSGTYDAAIAVGVYTKRFKAHFLSEMIRLLKPGGYFIFTSRELYIDEVNASLANLLEQKSISSAELRYEDYITGQDASAYYIALRKSS